MTQEEKAKAYDEAVNKIKPLYEQAKRDGNPIWSTYEYLIPQLRESEDERIRKHLIAIVELYWGKTNDPDKAKDLAYLEKQKEQKPADDTAFEEWIDGWFKEHKEKAYPQITMDEKEFKNFCRGIRNMYQQKPAEWEDYKDKVNVPYCSSEPEWSKEDENKLNHILEIVHIASGREVSVDEKEELESFLKSLRPSWKPSEEQMEALLWCVAHLGGADRLVLAELYEHLKMYCK